MTVLIRRPRWTAAVAAALVVLLVLAASALGLRLPGLGFLDVFGDRTELDYESRYFSDFVPLREPFVAERLGAFSPSGGTRPSPTYREVSAEGSRVTVKHPLTNDRFADAYSVPSVPFTAETTTTSASRDQGEPTSCSPVGGTVWYSYTATEDATLLVNTFGSSYATALGVFSGTKLGDLEQVGCNIARDGNARVGLPLRRGGKNYFQITGATGGGALVFSVEILARTTRISPPRPDQGTELPQISAEGGYVVFSSIFSPLPQAQKTCPTSGCQIFGYDRRTAQTEMISVSPDGAPGNGDSRPAGVSADGRFVVFQSTATNLLSRAVDCSAVQACEEVYVRDRAKRKTEIVSLSPSGEPANSVPCRFGCFQAGLAISADGRAVAFHSTASNLSSDAGCTPAGDLTGVCAAQIFVHDRDTRTTELASRSAIGAIGDNSSGHPCLSGNGRYVAFYSYATNLVKGDSNNASDVFVRDRATGRIERVSLPASGGEANGGSLTNESGAGRCVSNNGRHIMFSSHASNLVARDGNGTMDMFVRDLRAGSTRRVTISSSGGEANGRSDATFGLSGDGRFAAFTSEASNLVPGDTNGVRDVFVHDLAKRTTLRLSLSSLGQEGNGGSFAPSLSSRGAVATFISSASNLAAGDDVPGCPNTGGGTNCFDVFVHEGNPSI